MENRSVTGRFESRTTFQELHRPFGQICWGAQVVVREGVGVMLHVRADESEGAQYVQELKG